MHSAAWLSFLRQIPPARHENLSITTVNGNEIAIQSILRAEHDYLVIRGRMMGTTEGGNFFVVPFDQINFLSFHKSITEADVRSFLGESGAVGDLPLTATKQETALEPAPVIAVAPTNAPSPESLSVDRPQAVDKATLLERLRSRRAVVDQGPPTNSWK